KSSCVARIERTLEHPRLSTRAWSAAPSCPVRAITGRLGWADLSLGTTWIHAPPECALMTATAGRVRSARRSRSSGDVATAATVIPPRSEHVLETGVDHRVGAADHDPDGRAPPGLPSPGLHP